MKTQNETELYAQMGLAALIPGMQRMIELMQLELDRMRAQLTGLQASPRRVQTATKRGRPRKVRETLATGWPADPAERKLEAQRRMQVRLAKRAKATHPRHPDHPDHAAWVKSVSAAQKKKWAGMSNKQRKERLAQMAAGKNEKRAAADKSVVRLEVAS